jgi:hypothetical protein
MSGARMRNDAEQLHRADELCQPPWIIGAAQMLRAASLKTSFLIEGAVPARDLTMITAPPGSLKSWLAYDLCLAVVQQREWLGIGIPATAGSALVLNFDNPTAECGRRFMRLGMRPDDPIHFHSVDVGMRLLLPDAHDDLLAIVEKLMPRVILIDSMRQAHTAEENSSKEMGQVMAMCKSLYAYGAAVVVVHHSTKGSGSAARGSGEIDASVTAHISVDGDVAYWLKHRSWEQRPPTMPGWDEGVRFEVADIGDRTFVRRLPARERRKKKDSPP